MRVHVLLKCIETRYTLLVCSHMYKHMIYDYLQQMTLHTHVMYVYG